MLTSSETMPEIEGLFCLFQLRISQITSNLNEKTREVLDIFCWSSLTADVQKTGPARLTQCFEIIFIAIDSPDKLYKIHSLIIGIF